MMPVFGRISMIGGRLLVLSKSSIGIRYVSVQQTTQLGSYHHCDYNYINTIPFSPPKNS